MTATGMKVLIASSGPTRGSAMAKRFGQAPFYLCVDPSGGDTEVIDNRKEPDRSHAMLPALVARGVEVFIVSNIGPEAFRLIRSRGARVAVARGITADEALAKLQRGELRFLDEPTLARSVHEHVHRSAGSNG
jgi:predicted Fe-Mo cluster-binding NifX family protein